MNVKGKVAVVTGAGQGIGLEICRNLTHGGASVVLNDLDPELAEKGAAEIRSQGGRCVAVPGDSSQGPLIQLFVDTAVREFGSLDIAIANAGITLWGDFFEYTTESFQRVMQVNLGGSFFLAQAAARQMIAQGNGGRILFMSSVTGHQAYRNLAAYGMSKAALEMLAKNLVIELAPHKITVNAIAPGATVTERTQREEQDYEGAWSRLTPMGRPAYVSDIANAALFLTSREAEHITGQTLIVDGGWTSTSPLP